MEIKQLENGEFKVENKYARSVMPQGNFIDQKTIHQVFEVKNRVWRGIGNIPQIGYDVRNDFKKYNAREKFNIDIISADENKECISGDIMKGQKKPKQCPNFSTKCKPEHPLDAPMVNSEGACAAHYHHAQN